MSKSIKLTLSQFAHDLGAHHRITLEVSLVWHEQYVNADDVTRSALRQEFVVNFVRGATGITHDAAVALVALKRNERSADDEKVVNAAGQKFRYHLVRPEASSGMKEVDPVAQAIALLGKLTPAQLKKVLAAVAK